MRTSRLAALPLLLVGGLLVGCSDDGASADDTAAPSEAAADDATDEADADDEADDADDAAGTTNLAGAQCLEGTWEMDLTSVAETTKAAMSFTGMETEVEMTGTALVTFEADGSYLVEQSDLTTTMTMQVEGSEVYSSVTENGPVPGRYEADETHVTISDLDRSAVELGDPVVTIDGVPFEDMAGMSPEDMGLDGAGEGTSRYECSADELVLTTELEDLGLPASVDLDELDLSTRLTRR